MRLIRAHNAADQWLTLLKRSNRQVRKAIVENRRRSATSTGLVQFAAAVGVARLVYRGYTSGLDTAALLVFVLVFAPVVSGEHVDVAVPDDCRQRPGRGIDRGSHSNPQAEAEADSVAAASGRLVVGTRVPAVRVERVSYRYSHASTPALAEISFDIGPGRITALAGHSGSGKSTSVDIVLGLPQPDAGRVLVDGTDVVG